MKRLIAVILSLSCFVGTAWAEHSSGTDVINISYGQTTKLLWAPISARFNTYDVPNPQTLFIDTHHDRYLSIEARGVQGNSFYCTLYKNDPTYETVLDEVFSVRVNNVLEVTSDTSNHRCIRVRIQNNTNYLD